MAQQHLNHHRMIMIARQTIELPEVNSIKSPTFRVRAQLVESFAVQAPPILRPIAVDCDYRSTAFRDRRAAAIFLCFQADFILHIGRIPCVDRVPHPLLILVV